mmetsp:Transcript_38187/g.51674  ORF Transcript_38187/g.51674 Transcript_38187/m.51674 type:complete len:123 (-) Transcript_38187:1005-1373(-)|eukprot:CAMPEP_0185745180 /NCGR_PEP_ID=MMETSP1174-20130828/3439_1 /TAXON_ID=35687 /ORGANISM="Dictyocha speculum, Strain CCMP1381" /LENGTH=122 /DNA_ID=CAMNT_0028419001 /DNA_START=40 /DNA_END=408 /DNA_ORIENTATION=-
MKTLKFFIQRAQVIQQYRAFLKGSRRLAEHDAATGDDIRLRVLQEFRLRKNESESAQIRHLLAYGSRQLALLESLANKENSALPLRDAPANHHDIPANHLSSSDDDGDPNAIRMGNDWPWQR